MESSLAVEGQGPEGHVLQGAQECPVPISFSTSLSMFCSFFPAEDCFSPLLSPCEQKMPLAKNSQVYTGSPPKSTQALSLTEAGHSLSPASRGPLLLIAPSPVIPIYQSGHKTQKSFYWGWKKNKRRNVFASWYLWAVGPTPRTSLAWLKEGWLWALNSLNLWVNQPGIRTQNKTRKPNMSSFLCNVFLEILTNVLKH